MSNGSKVSIAAHFDHSIRRSYKQAGVACLLLMSACSIFDDDIHDLKERCLADAKIVIHDPKLWKEYVAGANQNFLERKREFPSTGRAVPEYAPGFEERYGSDLKVQRSETERVKGKVSRDDIYILRNGKIVVQFVDFGLYADGFGHSSYLGCTGVFPEVYADIL